jgi:hypothetical protein
VKTENAAALRDFASRRVRRLTAVAIAGAAALTGAFTSLAAGSTHTKSTPAKQPAAAPTPTTVTAPEPSLTPSGSAATPPSQGQSQPAPVTPAPTPQPPVAVTGGS